MIAAFLKALLDVALNGFFKLFGVNRDNRDGKLEVINKAQEETINEVKKANDARSADNSALDSELRLD